MRTFKSFVENLAKDADKMFGRIKDRNVFRRFVSGCYLIARADGTFDANEKKGLAKLVKRNMPHYEVSDILRVLDDCQKSIDFDETFGTQEIMDDIAKSSTDEAESIVRGCCFIGAADGDFDDNEKGVVRDICKRCNLDPAKYSL